MNKDEHTTPVGLLQPLPIPSKKWESISMDFIMGLPRAQGKDCIYVVVDRLTKFAHFFAITSSFTAAQVVEVFFREVFRLHGVPKNIVSDRDIKFLSTFWQEVFRMCGTVLTPSTSYHLQTDGQTKIVNKWLEGYLCNYVSEQQKVWVRWLHLGEYCYNSSYHMSIRMSPFMAQYGYEAPNFVDLVFGDSSAPQAKDMVRQCQDVLKALIAQNQQKFYVDHQQVERTFEVGDMVYLRVQPFRQSSLKKSGAKKLKLRFYGPFKVVRRVGAVAYELELSASSKVHNVFHVSCLKKALGHNDVVSSVLPPLDEEG